VFLTVRSAIIVPNSIGGTTMGMITAAIALGAHRHSKKALKNSERALRKSEAAAKAAQRKPVSRYEQDLASMAARREAER